MKILITGGAGYVGSACLRYVAEQGHEVMAYDNLVMGHGDAVDGHPLVVGDIADTDLLTRTLRRVANPRASSVFKSATAAQIAATRASRRDRLTT